MSSRSPKKPEKPKKPQPRETSTRPSEGASKEARRVAAVVLEALAGLVGPGEAAVILGVSAPQYYKLEARALEGLVQACEPRPRGRVQTPQSELVALQKEHVRLQRDCARQQALVRALQRAAGVRTTRKAVSGATKGGKGAKGGRGRKRKKPVTRALRMAAELRDDPKANSGPAATAGGRGGDERGEQKQSEQGHQKR
jgi:hypothetical protein